MILQASIPRIMRAQAHGKVAKFEFSNTHPIFKPSNRDSSISLNLDRKKISADECERNCTARIHTSTRVEHLRSLRRVVTADEGVGEMTSMVQMSGLFFTAWRYSIQRRQ